MLRKTFFEDFQLFDRNKSQASAPLLKSRDLLDKKHRILSLRSEHQEHYFHLGNFPAAEKAEFLDDRFFQLKKQFIIVILYQFIFLNKV